MAIEYRYIWAQTPNGPAYTWRRATLIGSRRYWVTGRLVVVELPNGECVNIRREDIRRIPAIAA